VDEPADDFEVVFDELFPRAFRLARHIVGDAALAEDVAAEALARAYARWPKVSRLPWRDAWVLRVAANLSIDHVRRRVPVAAAVAALSPDEDAITLRLALAACLRALPRRQRQAVALHYLAGLTDGEVAQALGISAGSVKTHIHRGLTALRARLGTDIDEVVAHGLE
jgi:RNA polymerase sigma-70 factor (ECF subfamily)